MVYPANAFNSRLRGDQVPPGSKKTSGVGGPQSPTLSPSSFVLFFIFLPFFLKTKISRLIRP